MITAREARKLTAGSLDFKGPWFKFRYKVYLHKIKKAIENAAEHGYDEITVGDFPTEYLLLLEKEINNWGFVVHTDYIGLKMRIDWNEGGE